VLRFGRRLGGYAAESGIATEMPADSPHDLVHFVVSDTWNFISGSGKSQGKVREFISTNSVVTLLKPLPTPFQL